MKIAEVKWYNNRFYSRLLQKLVIGTTNSKDVKFDLESKKIWLINLTNLICKH